MPPVLHEGFPLRAAVLQRGEHRVPAEAAGEVWRGRHLLLPGGPDMV